MVLQGGSQDPRHRGAHDDTHAARRSQDARQVRRRLPAASTTHTVAAWGSHWSASIDYDWRLTTPGAG